VIVTRFVLTAHQHTAYYVETAKRANRLHICSEKGNVLSNKRIKLLCVSGGSFFLLRYSDFSAACPRDVATAETRPYSRHTQQSRARQRRTDGVTDGRQLNAHNPSQQRHTNHSIHHAFTSTRQINHWTLSQRQRRLHAAPIKTIDKNETSVCQHGRKKINQNSAFYTQILHNISCKFR